MRGGGGAALVERAHKREGVTSRLWCLCVGGQRGLRSGRRLSISEWLTQTASSDYQLCPRVKATAQNITMSLGRESNRPLKGNSAEPI